MYSAHGWVIVRRCGRMYDAHESQELQDIYSAYSAHGWVQVRRCGCVYDAHERSIVNFRAAAVKQLNLRNGLQPITTRRAPRQLLQSSSLCFVTNKGWGRTTNKHGSSLFRYYPPRATPSNSSQPHYAPIRIAGARTLSWSRCPRGVPHDHHQGLEATKMGAER